MTQFKPEFNQRLIEFIASPDDFIASMALVNALHTETVMAADQPYAIALEGQKVTPVFTSEDDFNHFLLEHTPAKKQTWVPRNSLDVLEEAIMSGLDGLVYNIKHHGDFANSTIFKGSEMVQFINAYTVILNDVMTDENVEADALEKNYLVPVFVHPNEDGSYDRLFPTISNELGDNYIPVFTGLLSFSRWYNDPEFGGKFRKAQGQVMTWSLPGLLKPMNGQNGIDETVGVAVDPFDPSLTQLLLWSDIK